MLAMPSGSENAAGISLRQLRPTENCREKEKRILPTREAL
jgi:hypothetical protein